MSFGNRLAWVAEAVSGTAVVHEVSSSLEDGSLKVITDENRRDPVVQWGLCLIDKNGEVVRPLADINLQTGEFYVFDRNLIRILEESPTFAKMTLEPRTPVLGIMRQVPLSEDESVDNSTIETTGYAIGYKENGGIIRYVASVQSER